MRLRRVSPLPLPVTAADRAAVITYCPNPGQAGGIHALTSTAAQTVRAVSHRSGQIGQIDERITGCTNPRAR